MSKILIDEADLKLVMDALVEAQNIDDSSGKWDRNEKAIDILRNVQTEQRPWAGLIRGVRVEGETVVITVKGGNNSARELCNALLMEKNT